MSKKLIIIKLGGGLIAPKDWDEQTTDENVINRLVKELTFCKTKLVLVTGSGNFGHAAVKKYGIETDDTVEKVRVVAKKIGQIVAEKIIDSQLVITHSLPWKLDSLLKTDKTPVLYGDVMKIGEIWSGERCIWEMLPELIQEGWIVDKIIQVGREDGVYGANREVVVNINKNNWEKLKGSVGGAMEVDVTGGMLHKVEESLKIAHKYGIKTWIINGRVEGRLKELLGGKEILGTVVG